MIATTFAATATTSFTVAALAGTPCDGSIPVSWNDMIGHRDYLVRFARRKLQDPALAEDAVHDVFEAVISGRASFAGRAALRSWLTAILKNKIIDVIRQRARYDSFDADEQDDDARQIECPRAQPDELAEQRELLRQTMQRIAGLPQGLRDVMQFRVLQLSSRGSGKGCEALRSDRPDLYRPVIDSGRSRSCFLARAFAFDTAG
jgi:RNA polymerase sigma-70 factor (ECF subfamily)